VADSVDQDLQDILLRQVQKLLPDIIGNEAMKSDLLALPQQALQILFLSSYTCTPEYMLFKLVQEKIAKGKEGSAPEEE